MIFDLPCYGSYFSHPLEGVALRGIRESLTLPRVPPQGLAVGTRTKSADFAGCGRLRDLIRTRLQRPKEGAAIQLRCSVYTLRR